MEVVLIWCLWYAIYRSVADTASNTAHLLVGQPVTPRGRHASTDPGSASGAAGESVPVRRSYVGRGLGAIFGLARESLLDGWYTGWDWGRQAYQNRDSRRGSWRPWTQPPTPDHDQAPAGEPRRPRTDRPGSRGGAEAPTVDPTDPGPRPGPFSSPDGGADERPWWTDPESSGPSPAPDTDPEGTPDPAPSSAGGHAEEEILDAHPVCWSDLEPAEQSAVLAAARAQWGQDRSWDSLTVDQCAATVRDWINTTYGAKLTSADVISAQASREDPTWLTGAVPSQPTPTCWSDLTPTERMWVVTAAIGRFGTSWNALTDEQRAAAVRDWINATYEVWTTASDVLAAQADRQDPTWTTGQPAPTTAATDAAAPESGTGDSPVLALSPATPVAGPTTHEGAPPAMTVTSGETTNIENTRTYYASLANHATNDIANQIELSRSYLSAAQLTDPGVLAALAAVEEAARVLASSASGVLTALESHRLMEEAVASTPGAADTDFYRN